MSELALILSLMIAGLAPRLALRYLQPILMQVLHRLCDHTDAAPDAANAANASESPITPLTRSGAEFWWRVLNVLAISGSMLLVLTFGYRDGFEVTLNDFLRRTLWLTTMGVFFSISVVAWQIWSRVTSPAARLRGRAPEAPLPTNAKLTAPPAALCVPPVQPGATS